MEVKVDYTSADGTAVAGVDYSPVSGTLIFAAGETACVTASVFSDSTELMMKLQP